MIHGGEEKWSNWWRIYNVSRTKNREFPPCFATMEDASAARLPPVAPAKSSCGYVATSHVSRIQRSNENALLDQYGALSKLVRGTCEYNFNCGKWSRGLHIAVRCKRVSWNWNLKVKKMLEICLNQRDIFSSALSRNFYSFFETENSSSIPNCLSIKLQGVKGVKLVCGALRIFFF